MLPKTKVSDLARYQQAQAHRLQIRLSKGGVGFALNTNLMESRNRQKAKFHA